MVTFSKIKGNLITLAYQGIFDVIAHGANCQKFMNAGIAGQIRIQIPELYDIDQKDTRLPISRLGDFTQVEVPVDGEGNTFMAMNLYTQYFGGVNLDYTALRLALRKVNQLYPGKHIGLPMIGCGIGGGEWSIVEALINRELKDMIVTIVEFKK